MSKVPELLSIAHRTVTRYIPISRVGALCLRSNLKLDAWIRNGLVLILSIPSFAAPAGRIFLAFFGFFDLKIDRECKVFAYTVLVHSGLIVDLVPRQPRQHAVVTVFMFKYKKKTQF